MKSSEAFSQSPRAANPNSEPPASVTEVTEKNVQAIVDLEASARQARSLADRFADAVARFCGSPAFLWTHVVWFASWIISNTLPDGPRFDPFPFTFLTLIVSLEAIFLSTFILISQNAETRLAERRNHLDLQINLLAEQENTEMMKLVEAIAKKLGVPAAKEVEVLEQATRPEELVAQIDQAEKPMNTKKMD